jgi:hypothetical protein
MHIAIPNLVDTSALPTDKDRRGGGVRLGALDVPGLAPRQINTGSFASIVDIDVLHSSGCYLRHTDI